MLRESRSIQSDNVPDLDTPEDRLALGAKLLTGEILGEGHWCLLDVPRNGKLLLYSLKPYGVLM